MAAPYTTQPQVGYNANPPADDGSATAANTIFWATIKTKLGDPALTLGQNINTALLTAFAKVLGGGGVTSTAVDYVVGGSDQGKLVRATAAAITVTTPDATAVLSPFVFAFLNNSTGVVTLDGSGSQTIDGSANITISPGFGCILFTDGTNWFTNGVQGVRVVSQPQGRLTLTSGTPVLSADVTGAGTVYYTPYVGQLIPIYNGTDFIETVFSELSMAMSGANFAAGAIYDLFVVSDAGTIRLGIGPVWGTLTAGSGARGTGAGTTELQRLNGIWTNKNSMTLRYAAAATVSIAANQATYVGSIYMDGTNSQVSCHVTYGQSRKWGIWNAYNRKPIILKMGDSTASWTYALATVRQSRATAGNTVAVFTGLAEEYCTASFNQVVANPFGASAAAAGFGIGVNSTTVASGFVPNNFANSGSTMTTGNPARHILVPSLGLNNLNSLEYGNTNTVTYSGTEASMQFVAEYWG